MTNTQFSVALSVPFLTLLLTFIVTTVSNRASIQDLRSEMRAGFSDLRTDLGGRMDRIETRVDRIETRIDRIETRLGHIEIRMDRIETRLDLIDTEIRVNHDSRLAVLEARVLGRAG